MFVTILNRELRGRAMCGVGALQRRWRAAFALMVLSALGNGCVAISDGPTRLYPIAEETQRIRNIIPQIDFLQFVGMDEPQRFKYRNDWVAARMYAIDIQYTSYESGLTRERQGVGFAAAATTLGLTTASGLVAPVATKNLLTGLAGFVTGTRAAYDNDVLLAHSVQWIQSQMRTQRSIVGERILRGLRLPTNEYPIAAALTDLEDYYRAGTFTGGILGTSDALGAEARLAEQLKQDRIEVDFVPSSTGDALQACLTAPHPGITQAQQKKRLVGLMAQPSATGFALAISGQAPAIADDLLQRATQVGFCP
jgi:hypothetical protein